MINDIDDKLQSEMITLFDQISQFHLKEQAKKELTNINSAIDLRNVPKVPRYTYVTANGIDETQYNQLLEWVKNWIEEDQNRVNDYA